MVYQPIIDIRHIVSDERCYKIVRKFRWPHGTKCPQCQAECITKRGHDETHAGSAVGGLMILLELYLLAGHP